MLPTSEDFIQALAILLALGGIWLFLCVSIGIHETGHAITARALGVPITKMSIGLTKLFSFRIGGLPIEVGLIPLVGYVTLGDTHAPWHKKTIIAVAGPLTTLFLALLTYYLAGGSAFVATLIDKGFFLIPILKSLPQHSLVLPELSSFPATVIDPFLAKILVDLAGINLALAIANSLPIPPLDGGRALFALLEGVFGERILPIQEGLSVAGFFLIIGWSLYAAIFLK